MLKPDTAQEVLERADKQAKLLGATYGRLQCELLRPLIKRSEKLLAEQERNHVQCTKTTPTDND